MLFFFAKSKAEQDQLYPPGDSTKEGAFKCKTCRFAVAAPTREGKQRKNKLPGCDYCHHIQSAHQLRNNFHICNSQPCSSLDKCPSNQENKHKKQARAQKAQMLALPTRESSATEKKESDARLRTRLQAIKQKQEQTERDRKAELAAKKAQIEIPNTPPSSTTVESQGEESEVELAPPAKRQRQQLSARTLSVDNWTTEDEIKAELEAVKTYTSLLQAKLVSIQLFNMLQAIPSDQHANILAYATNLSINHT